jgi:hypothetical protein
VCYFFFYSNAQLISVAWAWWLKEVSRHPRKLVTCTVFFIFYFIFIGVLLKSIQWKTFWKKSEVKKIIVKRDNESWWIAAWRHTTDDWATVHVLRVKVVRFTQRFYLLKIVFQNFSFIILSIFMSIRRWCNSKLNISRCCKHIINYNLVKLLSSRLALYCHANQILRNWL